MFGKTELQKVLGNWIKNGGDLYDALRDLGDNQIKKKKDALAVSAALRNISIGEPITEYQISSPLHSLTAFFQQVQSEAAYNELVSSGLPELRRIFHEGLKYPENIEDDLMFILKILAMFQQKEDALLVFETARKGFNSDGFMWSLILGTFDKDHPHWKIILDGLRKPLPNDFLCIAYLDFVNGHAINDGLKDHPFDATEGIERLRIWLEDNNEENFSYAHSAAAAIPFLNKNHRDLLLEVAQKHFDNGVKIEAAWAMAKIGDRQGIENLEKWAIDVNHSSVACRYLRELGFEDEIPTKALEDDFQAMAEMADWLSHPNEFGKPPDNIELFDTRVLFWPPTGDKRKVWLFNYSYEPHEKDEERDAGIAMVGSITFALFGEATENLKPEEVYGLHCAWELEMNNSPILKETRNSQVGLKILRKYNEDL